MLGKRKWLALCLVVALVTMGISASAGADSGSENSFVSAINSTRSSSGLGSLKVDGGLRSHARNHSADMAAAGDYFHSSNGELQAAAGGGWTKLGENVGRGGSVSSLYQAFLNSGSHRANILGDYNYVGVGTTTDSNGVLYVTMVFMKKGSTAPPTTTTTVAPKSTNTTEATAAPTKTSSSSPKSGSKSSASESPAPTTTTTVPPTTTTTLIVGPDKPVTPGMSCFEATRFGWTCHD